MSFVYNVLLLCTRGIIVFSKLQFFVSVTTFLCLYIFLSVKISVCTKLGEIKSFCIVFSYVSVVCVYLLLHYILVIMHTFLLLIYPCQVKSITAAQKKLAKVNTAGMKSLSNFFKKKLTQ